jgi:hypothetical protein
MIRKSVFRLYGLQNYFIKGERCRRCDFYLENSIFQEKIVVLSVSKSVSRGFMCVRCITNPNNSTKNFFRSPSQITRFLKELKKREVKE